MASVTTDVLAAALLELKFPNAGEVFADASENRKRELRNRAARLIKEIEDAGFNVTVPV